MTTAKPTHDPPHPDSQPTKPNSPSSSQTEVWTRPTRLQEDTDIKFDTTLAPSQRPSRSRIAVQGDSDGYISSRIYDDPSTQALVGSHKYGRMQVTGNALVLRGNVVHSEIPPPQPRTPTYADIHVANDASILTAGQSRHVTREQMLEFWDSDRQNTTTTAQPAGKRTLLAHPSYIPPYAARDPEDPSGSTAPGIGPATNRALGPSTSLAGTWYTHLSTPGTFTTNICMLAFAIAALYASFYFGQMSARQGEEAFKLSMWEDCVEHEDILANSTTCRALLAQGFDAIVGRRPRR